MKNNKKAFTIVELVIVIAVIAVLTSILIPTFSSLVNNAKISALKQEITLTYENYLYKSVEDSIEVDDKNNYAYAKGYLNNNGDFVNDSDIYYYFDGSIIDVECEYTYVENSFFQNKWAILKYEEKYWKGKKWFALGTSITSNTDTNQDGVISGTYANKLEELSGLSQTNKGVEGAAMGGHILLNAMVAANQTAIKNADLITIEGAVNDWYSARPLGSIDDTISNYENWNGSGINLITGFQGGTFAGSCYTVFNYLKNTNPNALIVLLTDCLGVDGLQCDADIINSLGYTQRDYYEMMIAIAEKYGITVIDAGNNCGIDQYSSDCFTDHIHLNDFGGEKYAKYIWSQLKSMRMPEVSTDETVTVTFRSNSETIGTQIIKKGNNAIFVYPGTNSGYYFDGYNHTLLNIQEDTVIDAIWEENFVTLSFDTDGGTEISSITQKAGSTIVAPENPTKEGYIFDGWDKDIPLTMPSSDTTIKAYWRTSDNLFSRLEGQRNKCMVYGEGGVPQESNKSDNFLSGIIARNNKPVIIEFDLKSESTANQFTMASFTLIVYSSENSPTAYSIFFENSNLTNQSGIQLTKDGLHYRYVYTRSSHFRIAFNSNVENITVKYQTFTVTFKDGDETLSSQTVVYGESAVTPDDPTKENYIFNGWDKSYSNITANRIISALWIDEDELFNNNEVVTGQYLNQTANGTASGYNLSNYIACSKNQSIIIDLTCSSLGDFRIATASDTNDSYPFTFILGQSGVLVNSDTYNHDSFLRIEKTTSEGHIYLTVTMNGNYNYFRFSYQPSRMSNISVKYV